MPQAKTLTAKELRRVLDSIASKPHAARNRLILLMTHWAGMRVGEVAALRTENVRSADGSVKREIRLDATQTKGKHARAVFLNDRLRKEISLYLQGVKARQNNDPLFSTQKRSAFSANTLCQTMNAIYRRTGIDGAMSHSRRRSFITALASKGIGVRVPAALAGHRSIVTTQAYIDVNDAMKRAAVELA